MSSTGQPGVVAEDTEPWARTVDRSLAVPRILFDAAIAACISAISVRAFNAMLSSYYGWGMAGTEDQAIFNHLFWNISHRLSWENTVIHPSQNFLASHFSIIYFPLSFIYSALYPRPPMMLAIHVAFIGAACLVFYYLALHRLRTRLGAAAVTAIVVLHPAIYDMLFVNGFHDTALAFTFFMLALHGYEKENFALFAIAAALALMCKEDLPPILFGFSALALLQHRTRKWILFPTIYALGYAVVALGCMSLAGSMYETNPSYSIGGFARDLTPYAYLGNGPLEIFTNLFRHPGLWVDRLLRPTRLGQMNQLYGPLGYLSLLAPEYVLVPLSQYAEIFLSDVDHLAGLSYWYVTPFLPFAFYAFVVGVDRLASFASRRLQRFGRGGRLRTTRIAVDWVAALMLCYVAVPRVLPRLHEYRSYRSWFIFEHHHPARARHAELLAAIPPEAPVCAQWNYTFMFSSRPYLYCLPRGFTDCDYYVINERANRYPASDEEYAGVLATLADPLSFELVLRQEDIRIYRRLTKQGHAAPGRAMQSASSGPALSQVRSSDRGLRVQDRAG